MFSNIIVNPADCLPPHLRGATVTKIAAGRSGAGVYRVDAEHGSYVLKIADGPLADWRCRLHVQRLAAGAGVAPRVIHADEERRALLTEFVVDRSFSAYFMNTQTQASALEQLGRTLRRVHDLPMPADLDSSDPRASLATVSGQLASVPVPVFVRDAVRTVLDAPEPPRGHALVLSHNDVHPTNVLYDGTRMVLLDWQVAGANDPLYDLAMIAMFLRMDEASCLQLIAAHEDAPVTSPPARFVYLRKLVAALCGAMGLTVALQSGHIPAGGESLHSTPELGQFYRQLRAGKVNLAAPEGVWAFGLALLKTSTEV